MKLVDQDVLEAALVMLTHLGVVAHDLVGAQHQLGKVHHTFALALVFVGLVDGQLHTTQFVARRQVLGTLPRILRIGDEIAGLLGHALFFVKLQRLDDAFDGRELILGVQNLKRLRQTGQLRMRAQKAVAQTVESADPHGPRVHR